MLHISHFLYEEYFILYIKVYTHMHTLTFFVLKNGKKEMMTGARDSERI
jgi:hypothetical protein